MLELEPHSPSGNAIVHNIKPHYTWFFRNKYKNPFETFSQCGEITAFILFLSASLNVCQVSGNCEHVKSPSLARSCRDK